MSDDEIRQASNALIQWFLSQDIGPPEAGLIMSATIARNLVSATRNVRSLQEGLNHFNTLLACDIALELK